jgi:hypothetical protein
MRQFRVIRLLSATALLTLSGLPAQAAERNLTLVNQTRFAIEEFYAANVSREEWGDNRIAGEPLAAGASVRVDLDDGTGYCLFNLRAVFEDGEVVDKESVDICDAGRFYYRPPSP